MLDSDRRGTHAGNAGLIAGVVKEEKMSEEINHNRRRFLGATAVTIAAARFGLIGSADAQSDKTNTAKAPPIRPETSASFGALKQIDAGVLNVAYAEDGPADGPAVILLHGWPYDIHSYVEVAPLLASKGYRVIVPYLRGYGATRFLSNETFRNGQQSALAVDVIALMDALKIEKAIIGGFDWGARTANIMAALWPERCKALVSVSGYLIGNLESNPIRCRCRQRPSSNGGTNFILRRNAAAQDTKNTGMILTSSSGGSLRQNGTSMTLRSTAARRPSITRIMSASSSIITVGGSAWPKANRSMTTLKSGLPKVP
jgi:pimeloyl-ACP methyl ester carboxylesterase